MEEFIEMLIEGCRFLEVDGMAGVRNDDEAGAGNRPLHQQCGLEAWPVFVPGHDQRRRRTAARMLGELISELPPAARVLVLELHARRPERIAHSSLRHADFLEAPRGGLGLGGELRPLVGRRPVAATSDYQRTSAIGIGEAEMQRRKTAHGQADHMRLVDLERIDDRLDVITCALLRVSFAVVRHVGGRIAAGIERDAAIAAAEIAHLRFPGPAVACEFVDEDDRDARSDLLVKELHAVVGGEMGHAGAPQNRIDPWRDGRVMTLRWYDGTCPMQGSWLGSE